MGEFLTLSCTGMRANSKPLGPNLMDNLMKKPNPSHLAAALALVLALPVNASAQSNVVSTYTDINLNECIVLKADDFGASYACPGYKGYPLLISEGDLRFFVSYGFGAPDEMAAGQTVPAFNTLGEKLEWRLSNKTGDFIPFATILRYFTQSGDSTAPDGQILVVTKIEPGNTCHIAYIDAKLTPNANEVAQKFADAEAPDFNCATDEPHYVPS